MVYMIFSNGYGEGDGFGGEFGGCFVAEVEGEFAEDGAEGRGDGGR